MRTARAVMVMAAVLSVGGALFAQEQTAPQNAGPDISGTYTGSSNGTGGEMWVTATIAHEAGKISGRIDSSGGSVAITSGTLDGDSLSLVVDMSGATGSMTGSYRDGRIEADWTMADQSGRVVLIRVTDQDVAKAMTGQWEGTADGPEGPVPFVLTLKVDGTSVTGDISSSPISGTLKDGVATFSFAYTDGATVVMDGEIQDGRLTGTFSYGGGQFSGAWRATKRP